MTTENGTTPPVRQLRLVVETEDYEAALTFYRDVLGLVEREAFQGEGDARITILEAGRATLELSNPAQVRLIDQVEAGGQPGSPDPTGSRSPCSRNWTRPPNPETPVLADA